MSEEEHDYKRPKHRAQQYPDDLHLFRDATNPDEAHVKMRLLSQQLPDKLMPRAPCGAGKSISFMIISSRHAMARVHA